MTSEAAAMASAFSATLPRSARANPRRDHRRDRVIRPEGGCGSLRGIMDYKKLRDMVSHRVTFDSALRMRHPAASGLIVDLSTTLPTGSVVMHN